MMPFQRLIGWSRILSTVILVLVLSAACPAADSSRFAAADSNDSGTIADGPSSPSKTIAPYETPRPGTLRAILWGLWVGWIFSTVGAFGGIMAGVGHITIFGLGDYATALGGAASMFNKALTDSIRVSNHCLAGFSALTSSLGYYRMGRIVAPLGICLGLGGVLGALLVPMLTSGRINPGSYVGYFGVCVMLVGALLLYETTPKGWARKSAAKAAAVAFERDHIRRMREGPAAGTDQGVQVTGWSVTKISFTFYGVDFSFNPVATFFGGFAISAVAAFIGVGGGFLYVPLLTSVMGLPMFVVAGTSAVAVAVSMATAIFLYTFLMSVPVDWRLVGFEMLGIFFGSMIGPWTAKFTPDLWLERIFVLIALYVGIGYTTKGFLGYSVLPGM